MCRSALLAVPLLPSLAFAGALEVFEIPDADPPNGLYRPDIQASYPQVNWQTLDVLCLPAGQFKFIRIGNLPDRTPQDRLTITNCAGQTRVGGLDHYYLFILGGGSHWRLTGQYSPASGTGHPDYPGHADGQYANSQGSYGILIDDEVVAEGNPSGLAVGSGATDFEIDFIEIRRVGFAGMLIKTDDDGSATMANVHIHDNYIHDTGSEGVYIGSTQTQPQHSIDGMKFYNNRVLRTGTEIFQLGQIGPNTEVYNNVFLAGAMDWKNPFQGFQNNSTQLGPRFGDFSFRNNIVIGAGASWMNFLGNDVAGDPHEPGVLVEIADNYYSDSRHFGAYVARLTQPGMTVRFARNRMRRIVFQRNEVDSGISDYDQFFRLGSGGVANTSSIEFVDNEYDGEQHFISNWDDPNQVIGNISGQGNEQVVIPAVRFNDSGFEQGFDWLKLEIWTAQDFNGQPVTYNQGDVVSVNGDLFECVPADGCAAGLDPADSSNNTVWEALPWPADDVRLSEDSPIGDVGLLDDTGAVFRDRFELF
ncbi:MAG: hypothetical protein U5L08_05140 [Xanthomonadales bacterium]|nr:hypothetical protein [Xanthomonadales bacterium]